MLLCQNAQTFNLEGSLVSDLATRLSCHLPFVPLPLMGFCLFNLDNLGCSTIAESNVRFPSSIRATHNCLPAKVSVHYMWDWCLQRQKRESDPVQCYSSL